MGQPKVFTEQERAELKASGLTPFEVWLPDVGSGDFWRRLASEGAAIRKADQSSKMDNVLDEFIADNWDALD